MKKCLVCDTEFEPKNPKGKFCSDACKMKAARNKKKNPTLPDGIIIPDKPVDQAKADAVKFAYDAPKIEKPNDEPPKVGRALSKYDQERRMKKLGF